MVNGRGYDGQQKDVIYDACDWLEAYWSQFSFAKFNRFAAIISIQVPRFPDLVIFVSMNMTELIALPLVNNNNQLVNAS